MTVYIIANGDITNLAWLADGAFKGASAIIAADGGVHHLYNIQELPSHVIGDYDSLLSAEFPAVVNWLEQGGVRFESVSAEKDETDLELAIAFAIDHCLLQDGDGDIIIYGGFGGRIDQELANMLLLAHPNFKNYSIELRDQYQKVWLMHAGKSGGVIGRIGDTISLIPIGGDTHIRQTTGLKWPLNNSTLSFGPARGISNVLTQKIANIDIKSGVLLAVHISRDWNR